MAFDEVLFPSDLSAGSQGGPMWSTDVVVLNSGHEVRNQNWQDPLWEFNAAFGVREEADYEALLAFFLARGGMARGFRFKDLTDYQATDEPTGHTGAPTLQLIKAFTSLITYTKNITKLASSPAVTMKRNGGAFSAFSLNVNTGIVTLTPDSTKTITNITQANPGVVTSAAHGFSNGDEIYIHSVVGMTEVNGTVFTIANVTTNTFEIVDTSGYAAYVSGGTSEKHVQTSETLVWTGEFHIPVRFNVDRLPATWEHFQVRSPDDVPLIETRDIA